MAFSCLVNHNISLSDKKINNGTEASIVKLIFYTLSSPLRPK